MMGATAESGSVYNHLLQIRQQMPHAGIANKYQMKTQNNDNSAFFSSHIILCHWRQVELY